MLPCGVHTYVCLSIDGGLGVEQGPGGLEVALLRGVVQGGGPSVVGTGRVGMGVGQQVHRYRSVAVQHGLHQWGLLLPVLWGVGISCPTDKRG